MKKTLLIIGLGLLVSLGLFACAPVQVLNTITPSGGFEKMSDVSFGDHPRLKLDVYRPKEADQNAPVVVFVHGGSWSDGSKNLYKFMGESLTSEGMIAVIPNYRLHPGIFFPDPIVDSAKAVAWAANEYPDRPLFIMGHSAGAYNILMTASDPQFLSAEGIDRCNRINGVISLSGPVGIVPLKEEPYITIFPDRFTKRDAPLNQTENPAPPLLLVHGVDDTTVYPQNAEQLGERLSSRGANVSVKIYDNMNHTDPVKFFSKYFDGDSTVEQDVYDFIRTHQARRDNYCQ